MSEESSFPSAEAAAVLPLDQLAIRLLVRMREQERAGRKLQIRGVISQSAWTDSVGQQEMPDFLRLLQEAWDWLYAQGLIAGGDHTQSSDTWWTFVTRRGHAVLDDPNGLAPDCRASP